MTTIILIAIVIHIISMIIWIRILGKVIDGLNLSINDLNQTFEKRIGMLTTQQQEMALSQIMIEESLADNGKVMKGQTK